jgi:hypothetical protein
MKRASFLLPRPASSIVSLIALVTVLAAAPFGAEAASILSISGRVFSMRGEALEGAYVRHASAGTYTGANGTYTIPVMQPGCYLVTASGPGLPDGAYFETSRDICVGLQGKSGQDFRVPYQLYGEAEPAFLNSLQERSVTQSGMIFCPPESCLVKAQLYHQPFGADVSTLGAFVGTFALAYDSIDQDGFVHHRGVIPIPAGAPPGWYQVVREARNPATNELQSRCMFDRCWNYFAVDNTPPRLGSSTPQGWVRTGSPIIRIPFADEQDVGLDLASLQLRLDGEIIPNNLLFIEGSLWSGAVTYHPGGLAEGLHEVWMQVADRAGNAAEPASFSFKVDTIKPSASQLTPTGTISSSSPKIAAQVADAGPGQIDPVSIMLTLSNGILTHRLAHSFDPSTGNVVYQVPQDVRGPGLGQFPLTSGSYTVRLRLGDLAGNLTETSWTFKVNMTPSEWIVAWVETWAAAPLSPSVFASAVN